MIPYEMAIDELIYEVINCQTKEYREKCLKVLIDKVKADAWHDGVRHYQEGFAE